MAGGLLDGIQLVNEKENLSRRLPVRSLSGWYPGRAAAFGLEVGMFLWMVSSYLYELNIYMCIVTLPQV